jgi:hypothetical protein
MQDCYKSILEALYIQGFKWNKSKCNFNSFEHILASNVEEIKRPWRYTQHLVLGKGELRRKIEAVRYARENKVPFRNLFGDANGHNEYSRNVRLTPIRQKWMSIRNILSLIWWKIKKRNYDKEGQCVLELGNAILSQIH